MTNDADQPQYDALIFIHGFLDNHTVWNDLIEVLAPSSVPVIARDLRGAGHRRNEDDACTLMQAVVDIVQVFDDMRLSRVALVGHSMGAQIAELVASERAAQVASLTLITPTPLRGNMLPVEVRDLLRESGDLPAVQREIRVSFSTHLNGDQLNSLTAPHVLMNKATVRQYYDAFTLGDPRGNEPCAFRGPTMVIGAQGDPVIPIEQIADECRERFPAASLRIVAHSGHWPHLEQPAQTARLIARHLGLAPLKPANTVRASPRDRVSASDESR
ncbi:alpha/beta fold hydrolase [Paraburkholderia aromaticivorans]|uniref:alpha/beta fold hydrolase n=1 Tax=Paraburkholderia aromaticivorans TaxID=2026199 RepID=UPI001F0E4C3E|nr:alpha/beta hydrolase [Paraburkholderia aromaticivorans]